MQEREASVAPETQTTDSPRRRSKYAANTIIVFNILCALYICLYGLWSRCFAWHNRMTFHNPGVTITVCIPRYGYSLGCVLFRPLISIDYSYRRLYCSGILDLGNENEFTDFFGGTLGNVKEWDTVKWPPGAKREPMKCFRVGERGKMARPAPAPGI